MAIIWDFTKDLLQEWKGWLGGSLLMVALSLWSEVMPEAPHLPLWVWIILIFVAGLLCAMYQMYANLRRQIGTGMIPLPNMSLEDVISDLLGKPYKFGDGVEVLKGTDTLLKVLGQEAAHSNITVWGRRGTSDIFPSLQTNLVQIPSEFWETHQIDLLECLKSERGQTSSILNLHSHEYFDLAFNKAQLRYFKRMWKKKIRAS